MKPSLNQPKKEKPTILEVKKEADNLRSSLTVGDNVLTIGGITGTICAVKEGTVVIETGADRVRLEMTKESIATRFTKDAKTGESK